MKTIRLAPLAAIFVGSMAFAAAAPQCNDGRFLVSVTKANFQTAGQTLAAAQANGQLTVRSSSNSLDSILLSVQANGDSAKAALDSVAALPGSIIECDEVIDPAF